MAVSSVVADGSHGIADEPHLVGAQGVLVLGDGQNAERYREIFAREHGLYAVELPRRGGVDRSNLGVWLGAAQQLAVEHPGEREIVGEARGARHLGDRVHFTERLPDDLVLGHARMRSAASSTAS